MWLLREGLYSEQALRKIPSMMAWLSSLLSHMEVGYPRGQILSALINAHRGPICSAVIQKNVFRPASGRPSDSTRITLTWQPPTELQVGLNKCVSVCSLSRHIHSSTTSLSFLPAYKRPLPWQGGVRLRKAQTFGSSTLFSTEASGWGQFDLNLSGTQTNPRTQPPGPEGKREREGGKKEKALAGWPLAYDGKGK